MHDDAVGLSPATVCPHRQVETAVPVVNPVVLERADAGERAPEPERLARSGIDIPDRVPALAESIDTPVVDRQTKNLGIDARRDEFGCPRDSPSATKRGLDDVHGVSLAVCGRSQIDGSGHREIARPAGAGEDASFAETFRVS